MHYTVGTVPPPPPRLMPPVLGPGAHQCAAALGKMHDDRPSLNGVRTIMHLAKYETLRRRRGGGTAYTLIAIAGLALKLVV